MPYRYMTFYAISMIICYFRHLAGQTYHCGELCFADQKYQWFW